MSEKTSFIDYEKLTTETVATSKKEGVSPARSVMVKGLINGILKGVQQSPDQFTSQHNIYIGFSTKHPDLVIPHHLRARHPETMTIVLQHQFSNLALNDNAFSVMLRFSGMPAHITVPFDAISSIMDPCQNFGIQFPVTNSKPTPPSRPSKTPPEKDFGSTGTVVSLDAFRKK